MICCSFIFEPGDYDDDFHRLDAAIAEYARSLPGLVTIEQWQSEDGRLRNAMYFFEDEASVSQLARFPDHLQAKELHSRWYRSYRVNIMTVSATYGSTPDPLASA